MSFRCHFVSFGAGRRGYGSALKRLKKEIKRLDPDAQVWLFDEHRVSQEIGGLDQSFSDFARDNPRGYGLWVWKPWAVLEVMKSVQQGDIVFYLDAGCTVHTSAKSKLRYQWYINHIREHGSVFFELNDSEYYWTRREVMEHFCLTEPEVKSGQLVATIQGHMVNEKQLMFVKDWLDACTLDSGRLLKGVGMAHIEDERFIDHRHDQSVLSCLAKSKGITTLPDESFHHPKWNRDGDGFPFWATRKISGLPRWMGYYSPLAVIRGRLDRLRNMI